MDTALSEISKVEYIHSDEHLLDALRRFKGLRTYAHTSDRAQGALHLKMQELAAKGRVVVEKVEGNVWRWRSVA